MSNKINPREVLAYLNELGYRNVEAAQLQDFIRDLKKLIKYDELRTNQQVLRVNILHNLRDNLTLHSSVLSNVGKSEADIGTEVSTINTVAGSSSKLRKNIVNNISSEPNSVIPNLELRTVNGSLESIKQLMESDNNTKSSRHVSRKNIVCGLDKMNHKYRESTCTVDPSPLVSRVNFVNDSDKENCRIPSIDCSDGIDNKANSLKKCNRKGTKKSPRKCQHDFTHPCYCSGSMKPKSSVIKCNARNMPQFKKCDPVNLYKYYEKQWKINKIPGENILREQRFRWCCREKLCSGPPVKKF